MKTSLRNCLLAIATILLASATSLKAQTVIEIREVPAFSRITTSGNISVILTQSDITEVRIEAPAHYQEDIVARVSGNTLKLEYSGKERRLEPIKAYVSFGEISHLSSSGAGSFKSTNQIAVPSLRVSGSGASSIDLDIETAQLSISLSGASNVRLKGKATSHELQVSGASVVRAYDLETEVTSMTLSGASSAQVLALSSLSVVGSGTANLSYKGTPAVKNFKTSGMATIRGSDDGYVYQSQTGSDTVTVRMGEREVRIVEGRPESTKIRRVSRPRFRDTWTGLEIGVNGYLSPDQTIELQPEASRMELQYNRSIAVNLNLWQQNLELIRGRAAIVTGLGFGWNNYRFADKQMVLVKGEQQIEFATQMIQTIDKSKLTVSYLNVPLMLEIQTRSRHTWSNRLHLSGGINTGIRLGSHTKQVSAKIDGNKDKVKEHSDFYLNPFRFDATARLGWGPVNLFASYALNPLFRDGKGPELTPFTVGIRVLNF